MAKQRTALVVEDNALVAMEARETLALHGFAQILVFSSAEFAAGAIRNDDPDFALIVTHLDEGDTAPLAAMLADRDIPFAFVSDFANGLDIPFAYRARPFVTKPYTTDDLSAVLTKLGLDAAPSGVAPPV